MRERESDYPLLYISEQEREGKKKRIVAKLTLPYRLFTLK
jgi:hypothetical protein